MGEAEEEEAKDEEVGEEGRMRKPRTRTGWVPCSKEVTRTERCEGRQQDEVSCASGHHIHENSDSSESR